MLKEIRGQFLAWLKIAGGALTKSKLRLGRSAIGVKKYLWLVFVVVLAGNVMAFNYYQARLTRYYLRILHANVVRMSEDIDGLDAKLNQLGTKIDGLEAKIDQLTTKTNAPIAKLDKPALPPPTSLAPPPRRCTGIFC